MRDDPPDSRDVPDRRSAPRVDVTWAVDCETSDTFLYASIANISELGIFVRTNEPLQLGTRLTLRFAAQHDEPFVLDGVVQWVNAVKPFARNLNPGMGVRFVELGKDDRQRLVRTIRTIAYVHTSTN